MLHVQSYGYQERKQEIKMRNTELMRVPKEFREWVMKRQFMISKVTGINPQKVHMTKVLKAISQTPNIYIKDSIIFKLFKGRKI